MQAAVTGASGHLGANLVRRLLELGWQVRALVHATGAALDGLELERCVGDLREPATLAPLVDGVDVVFHCAALISIVGGRRGRVHATNVDGVRHLAHAARDAGVSRFVHVSSCHAFDLSQARVDESSARAGPTHPAYDRSKWAGEQALRQVEGLDFVIVNPAALLGPHDYLPSRMGRLFLAVGRRRMPATVPGGFYFSDVRDVADALVAAWEQGASGDNHLLGGHYASIEHVVALAAEAFGVAPPPFVVPTGLARLVAPVGTWWGRLQARDPLLTTESLQALAMHPHSFDQSHAQAVLSFDPRPLADTVRDACADLRRIHEAARGLRPR